jgi:hypothetical protein
MSPMCSLKPARRIGMELLVSVEADNFIHLGENESYSERFAEIHRVESKCFPLKAGMALTTLRIAVLM